MSPRRNTPPPLVLSLVPVLIAACVPTSSGGGDSERGMRALSRRAGALLRRAVAEYNRCRPAEARGLLAAVLAEAEGASAGGEFARIRAKAHFYLGAGAWDMGEAATTDSHFAASRRIDPAFEPDWKYISPGLRGRYEAAQ